MTFSSSERGISPVLGGILLFGLAMSLLILTQVSVVPAANTQIEFEHNQRVQDDFERFQGSASRVAATGAPETVNIELGVRYPNRLFLVNPSPVYGTMTTENATVRFSNVTAINPETADYFTSEGVSLDYSTKRLLYEPNYNEYTNAPVTVFENGNTFSEYADGVTLVTSATPVLNDGDITLILIDGDVYEEGTDAASLSLQAASAPGKRIAVTNADTGPITITFQTTLPEREWNAFNDSNSEVIDLEHDGNSVVLTLDPTRDYTLRVARLTVGDSAAGSDPAYVTSVGTPESSIPVKSSITYTVEVRDAFNNPVSGGTVLAEVSGAGTFEGSAVTKQVPVDEDGRASVTVVGKSGAAGVGVADTSIGLDRDGDDVIDTGSENAVNYSVQLAPTAVTIVEADFGGSINPNSQAKGDLALTNTTVVSPKGAAKDSGEVILEFQNLADDTKALNEVRFNFVSLDGQGASVQTKVTEAALTKVDGTARTAGVDSFPIGGDYQAIAGPALSADPNPGTLTLQFQFQTDDGSKIKAEPGDFFVVSVVFDDGTTAIYLAGVL